MSDNPIDTQGASDAPKKPGTGATIGSFFLCWILGALCCAISSMMFAKANGYIGYSVGGLGTLIAAICCAAYYHSSGKLGIAVLISVVIGLVIGFLAVQLAIMRIG